VIPPSVSEPPTAGPMCREGARKRALTDPEEKPLELETAAAAGGVDAAAAGDSTKSVPGTAYTSAARVC